MSDVDVFIFDLFGVLISFDNDIVYSRLAKHCANPPDAFARLNGLMAGHEVITGKLTLQQIHDRLVDEYGLKLSYLSFENAWLEPYSRAMPGMAGLLHVLSEHYRLALLSNVDAYYWKVVQSMQPELKYFDSVLLSCELGLAKPDPEIFLHACTVNNAEPSRCLFVDDTRVNVDAASAIGLKTHRFTDVSSLRQVLLELERVRLHCGRTKSRNSQHIAEFS